EVANAVVADRDRVADGDGAAGQGVDALGAEKVADDEIVGGAGAAGLEEIPAALLANANVAVVGGGEEAAVERVGARAVGLGREPKLRDGAAAAERVG